MIHNVVFHNDIDGTFCAAIFMKYYLKKDDRYRLYPVSDSLRRDDIFMDHVKMNTDDRLYIFDFKNHKRANLWVDHHPSAEFKLHKIINSKMMYSPYSKSAASILYENTEIEVSDKENMKNIIEDVNMIDSAQYPDINYIFNDMSPLMILRSYMEKIHPSITMIFSRIVEVIVSSNFNLTEALSRLNISEKEIEDLRNRRDSAKKHMTIHNKISVIRQNHMSEFPRYSEYHIRPDVRWGIRVSSKYKKFIVQIAYNNWCNKPNELNIGKFLAKDIDYAISGGGHFNAGGCTINKNDLERLLNDFSIAAGNEKENPIEMEKYGVDKNDMVEKKAKELVKTGKVKDINEAREAITEGDSNAGSSNPEDSSVKGKQAEPAGTAQ